MSTEEKKVATESGRPPVSEVERARLAAEGKGRKEAAKLAKAEKKELAVRMEGEEEDSAVIETRSAPEMEQEWTWQVEFGRVCQN